MKYLIRLFFLTFFVLFSSLVSAKSFLWEIKDDDNSVFLLGSVHLLRESDFPLDKVILKALDKSEIVVFEADIAAMSSPQFQYTMLQESMLANGKTLKKILPSSLYKKTADKMSQNGLMIEMINGFKPWMAALTLQITEFKRLGFKDEFGVDQFLYRRAKMKGKQTMGFETPEFQMSLFSNLTTKQQIEFLSQTINELDLAEKMINQMLVAWKAGNADQFYNYNIKSFKAYPDLMDKLLISRNKNWMPDIVKLIEGNKDAMVVVGALHIPGKDGVLDLLQKKGYKTKQL